MKINKNDRLLVEINNFGEITYVNRKYCQVSGFLKDELLGRIYIKFLDRDVSEDLCKEALFIANKGYVWEGYLKCVTKDFDYFWTNVVFLKKDDGFIIKHSYATDESILLMEEELREFSKGMVIKSKHCGIIM